MMFSTNTPSPFTVKDLKKHLEYMDDNMIIRLVGTFGTNKFLSLVGRGHDEASFAFDEEEYFTGWDFENNCEK